MTAFEKKNNRRATVTITRDLHARPIWLTAFEINPARRDAAIREFYYDSIDLVREFEGSENPRNFMHAVFSDYGIDALLLKQILDSHPAPPVLIEFLNTHFKQLFKWNLALQSLDRYLRDEIDCVVFFKMFNRHFLTIESVEQLVTWHRSSSVLSGKPSKIVLDHEQALIVANHAKNLTVESVKNALIPLFGYATYIARDEISFHDLSDFDKCNTSEIVLLDSDNIDLWRAYGLEFDCKFTVSVVNGNCGLIINVNYDSLYCAIDIEESYDCEESNLNLVSIFRKITNCALRGDFNGARIAYELNEVSNA
jgi:hypothetical protein